MFAIRIVTSCAVVSILASVAGCQGKKPADRISAQAESHIEDSEGPRVPPVLDARIEQLTDSEGTLLDNAVAGEPFTVSGSFRIAEEVHSNAPPVIVKVRDRNGVVHGSASTWSVKQSDGRYAFDAQIDTVQQVGAYSLEVRVLGETIQEQELDVALN